MKSDNNDKEEIYKEIIREKERDNKERNYISIYERGEKEEDNVYIWRNYNEEKEKYSINKDKTIYNNILSSKQLKYQIDNIRVSYSKNIEGLKLVISELLDKKKKLNNGENYLFEKRKNGDRILAGFLGVKRNNLNSKSKYYSEDENEFIFFRECYWHLTYHPNLKNNKDNIEKEKRIRLHFSIHDYNTPDYKSKKNNNPFLITFVFFNFKKNIEDIDNIEKLNLFDILSLVCDDNMNIEKEFSILHLYNGKEIKIHFKVNLYINISSKNIYLKIILKDNNKEKFIVFYPYLTSNYPGNIISYIDERLNSSSKNTTSSNLSITTSSHLSKPSIISSNKNISNKNISSNKNINSQKSTINKRIQYNLFTISVFKNNNGKICEKIQNYKLNDKSYVNNYIHLNDLIDCLDESLTIKHFNFISCKLIDDNYFLLNNDFL